MEFKIKINQAKVVKAPLNHQNLTRAMTIQQVQMNHLVIVVLRDKVCRALPVRTLQAVTVIVRKTKADQKTQTKITSKIKRT